MNNNTIRNWLALNHLYNLDGNDALRVNEHFSGFDKFFKASVDDFKQIGLTKKFHEKVTGIDWSMIDAEIAWSEREGNNVITFKDTRYPPLLREIQNPPVLLFIQGDVTALSANQVAMVGSRNPSPTGYDIARDFGRSLAQHGFIVTSGLAMGIDAAGHHGAMHFGRTVAVLGTGLDNVYPLRNKSLARQIIDRGALVSEFPLQTAAKRINFPRRNRIISGLSLGVLVIEASIYSGSLITARLAGEQGREIFAIPGSIHNPMTKGCHKLIRQGAKLVESVDDIIEELKRVDDDGFATDISKSVIENAAESHECSLDSKHRKLLSCVGFETTTVEMLCERTGFRREDVVAMLLFLELNGSIKPVFGGYARVK